MNLSRVMKGRMSAKGDRRFPRVSYGSLGCLMACVSMVSIHAQTVQFEALAIKGGKKATASCVLVSGKGVVATVVELGADMKKATLEVNGKTVPLTYMANDLNSRLVLYKLSDQASKAGGEFFKTPTLLGSSLKLNPSDLVFVSPSARKDSSRVVGMVNSFQGKILPLGVWRINHAEKVAQVGSGVYDTDGKLVALVRQPVFGASDSSYCLPVEVISRTLNDFKRNGKVQRCWIGIVMDELVSPPIVESVRPGSPASKAGLKKGDVVLRIGERKVLNYSEVVDAFFYLIAGESKVLKVLRGTEVKDISVTPEASPKR